MVKCERGLEDGTRADWKTRNGFLGSMAVTKTTNGISDKEIQTDLWEAAPPSECGGKGLQ